MVNKNVRNNILILCLKENYCIFVAIKNLFMVKRIAVPFALLFLISSSCFATGENWAIGGRSAGMGNASVTLNDLWAIHNNQAGLAGIKNISAGIYYENLYGLKELGLKAGVVELPTKSGVFGLSMSYFGYSQYNESKIGLAYAKSLGTKFSVGVQLDYLGIHIGENYGNTSAVAAEIGLLYKISKKLNIGAHIYNPTRAKIANYNNERVPTVFRLGLSYIFSDKVIVAAETEKDIQYNAAFKAGIEYHPVKQFYFRAGISTDPVLDAFGFGLELKNFNLDFAATYHQTLGFTPQVSIIFHKSESSTPQTKE